MSIQSTRPNKNDASEPAVAGQLILGVSSPLMSIEPSSCPFCENGIVGTDHYCVNCRKHLLSGKVKLTESTQYENLIKSKFSPHFLGCWAVLFCLFLSIFGCGYTLIASINKPKPHPLMIPLYYSSIVLLIVFVAYSLYCVFLALRNKGLTRR